MKKHLLLSRRCLLASLALAVLAVACGLKITSVEFSTRNPEQGSTLTVKTTLTQEGDNNQANYYLLYAVRVPSDWAGQKLEVNIIETVDEVATATAVEMVECGAYAKLCEYCYPQSGYKWVAYQSAAARQQGSDIEATVSLAVGEALGSYRLDIMTGGWQKEPTMLLDSNGALNLSMAFGSNCDFTDFNCDDNKTYFNTSEYLFNASTLAQSEIDSRATTLAMSATATVTIDGKGTSTLPVHPDIANINADADLSVTVVAKTDGIEAVAADGDAPARYYDLNGREAANPDKGLYIVKRGNKATKELLK